jgi:NADPH:quinone reductase-like Zn-dependent oxidoreductase
VWIHGRDLNRSDGTIRSSIQERVPLAEAARAQALLESGGVLGKLVLKP